MATLPTVLIGYGSIGRYHARILAERSDGMAVVEIDEAASEAARSDFPHAAVSGSLSELSNAGWPWERTLAVIATWGPSHAALFEQLAELGVRRVLCEKPLANSISAGGKMLRLAREHRIALGVHQRFRYIGLVPAIRELAARWELGEPVAIVVSGGAMCLVTNGIHYIDLAGQLFGSPPRAVVSTAIGVQMNPRSKSLNYYGGTAVWSYDREREAVISFTNSASLRAITSIYFPHGVIELRPTLEVTVRRRPLKEVEVPITRTGMPSEVMHNGALPGLRAGVSATEALMDEIEAGDVQTFRPEEALQAVEACIGALVSGRSGHSVELPIDPDSAEGQEEWPIS